MFKAIASLFTGGSAVMVIYAVIGTAVIAAAIGLRIHVKGLENDVLQLTEEKSQLVAANKIYERNNGILTENVNTLTTANNTNLSTIASLKREREDAINSVKNLAAANMRDKARLANLNKRLSDMLKDPATDGKLAPILKEVIREIQAERASL